MYISLIIFQKLGIKNLWLYLIETFRLLAAKKKEGIIYDSQWRFLLCTYLTVGFLTMHTLGRGGNINYTQYCRMAALNWVQHLNHKGNFFSFSSHSAMKSSLHRYSVVGHIPTWRESRWCCILRLPNALAPQIQCRLVCLVLCWNVESNTPFWYLWRVTWGQ